MTPKIPLKNILIIRTDRMGDVVLTTPVFKSLCNAYPRARISVLVTPATYDLVNGNPYIDEVIVDDRKTRHKDLFGFLYLARELRQRSFDAAFIFHTKRRYNLAAYVAGIPMRIGYKNKKFGALLTHPLKDVRHHGLKHEANYCLDVVQSLGNERGSLDLFLPVDKKAEEWAVQWLQDNDIHAPDIIVIHPGASDTTRRWPASHFAQLIDRLNQQYPSKIILIGDQDILPLSQDIVRLSSKNIFNLTSKTTLAQTISILRRCRLLISNDSGPVHVGAAVDINVISLFMRNQPGINLERWKPLGPKGYILTNKPGEEIILNKKNQIASGKLDSITVDEVLELIEEIFRKDNQTTFYW